PTPGNPPRARAAAHRRGGVQGDAAPGATQPAASRRKPGPLWPGSTAGTYGTGTAGDGPPIVAGDTDNNGATAAGEPRPRGNAVTEPRQSHRRRRRPNMSWWVELPILLVFALVLA